MFLALILSGCGFGLQPLNPLELEEDALAIAEKKEYEEGVSALEDESDVNAEFGLDTRDFDHNRLFGSEEDTSDSMEVLDKEDFDGDGFSVAEGDCDDDDYTIFPGNPDLARDGIDQDCDGFDAEDAPVPCTYSTTMLCGYDGWEGLWLQAKGAGHVLYKRPLNCQAEVQSWSTTTSESFELRLNPGEEFALQICEDSGCFTPVREDYHIGLVVHVNNTLIEQVSSSIPLWSFAHSCPK